MFEVQEEDLSLFSGDILSNFPLLEDINIYDDLKTDLEAADPEAFNPSKEDIDSLASVLEPVLDDVTPWMENKVNLLDLLMNDGAIGDDSFLVPNFDVPVELPNIKSDSSPCQDSLSVSSNIQCNPDYGSSPELLFTDIFSDQVQQVDVCYDGDFTINASSDSGIDLSISESGQSLLELLPKQLIENLDDPSSLSLLLGNAGDGVTNAMDPAMSGFFIDTEKKDISDIGGVSTAPVSVSIDLSDGESSVSSSNPEVDMCYIPSGQVAPSDIGSPMLEADIEFDQMSLPSSPGSVLSVSSTRSSPYTREAHHLNEETSYPRLKSVSGGDRIKDKKLRKMRQNKDAATRYRIKKKIESESIESECSTLMARNAELKDQVETMTREIAYLKELMADVYQAKQAVKASKRK